MITDGKKWHYLAVKKLSTLIRGITSEHDGNFYCSYWFQLFSTKEKLKKHKEICKDHDYCYVEMSNKDNKILKYNHGEKLMKDPFLIYAHLECLLEKTGPILKDLKHPSLFAQCSFDSTNNMLDCNRGKDYMETFCKDAKK